jgi:predicted RNase H-like HicB family nuclease
MSEGAWELDRTFIPQLLLPVKAYRNTWMANAPSKRKPTRDFNIIIEKDADGFFVATVPELRGCHTHAKFLDVLMERIREAIALCLETQSNRIESPEFIGVQRISI